MTLIDYTVIVAYFAFVFAVGIYCARGQKSLREFLLADNDVPWWAAAFSGIATVVSGVAYLGAPGLAFSSNYTYHQLRLGVPAALFVLCVVMLPILFRLRIYSIYEYLERRFDHRVRLLASGLFMASKICYLAVVVYAPSLVVAEMTKLPILYVIMATGLSTALYTLIGGIKAVVWTDTMQLGVFLSGIAVVIAVAAHALPGGLGQVWRTAEDAGRLRLLNFSTDPTVTYTFWSGMIGGAVMLIAQWGSDQSEIQRFLTTKSVWHANAALISSLVVSTAVGLTLFFIGTSLFGFYTEFPAKGGLTTEPNRILAKFIVEELPLGLRGLLIAAVLAASMSTISAVLNSLATVTIGDFYPLLRRQPKGLVEGRWLTLGFGVVVTSLACFGDRFGNLLDASTRVINLFAGSLVGIFLLGMLSRTATARGAFWGTMLGLGVALYLNFGTRISFLWFGPVSATVAVVAALGISRLGAGGVRAVAPELVCGGNGGPRTARPR